MCVARQNLHQAETIINMVKGCSIEFCKKPEQTILPKPSVFDRVREGAINCQIQEMVSNGVVEEIKKGQVKYLSNVFSRPKPDGSVRVILDLTKLNKHVVYHHFKMDNLQTAIDLMSPGCFMASIDWKQAYFAVPIKEEFRGFLAFKWRRKIYQFTCLPNGLSSAPRLFTKRTKVFFSHLRKAGFLSMSYIDDCLLFGTSHSECMENVAQTLKLSGEAGFIVHQSKSVLKPTQNIVFLGFWQVYLV